jgi:hypothetical protein
VLKVEPLATESFAMYDPTPNVLDLRIRTPAVVAETVAAIPAVVSAAFTAMTRAAIVVYEPVAIVAATKEAAEAVFARRTLLLPFKVNGSVTAAEP